MGWPKAMVVLGAACWGCSGSAGSDAPAGRAEAPPPGQAPKGFDASLGEPALLRIDGKPISVANVFARRLPNTDATELTFVSASDVTCESLPTERDDKFLAALVVSRYFVSDKSGGPSKRPFAVRSATVRSTDGNTSHSAGKNWGELREPFIEPTTATLMFGKLDLHVAAPKLDLEGAVMAQVCLPAAADKAVENAQPGLVLTLANTKIRVRGATLTTSAGSSVLRISNTPLACDALPLGDVDVRVELDGKGGAKSVVLDGVAAPGSASLNLSFQGSAEVKKKAGADFELAIKGSFGDAALLLEGSVTARKCP